MSYKPPIFLLFIFILFPILSFGQINLYGNLVFGEYDVRIDSLTFIDTAGQHPRIIRITLWCPAKESKNEKLFFSDYLNYNNVFSTSELIDQISTNIGGANDLFSKDSLELILNASTKTSKYSEEVSGKFPVLIWSCRYETISYQNILSEYLSSHGYIVAFPEEIPNSPYPWELQAPVEKETALNLQVSDITSTISILNQRKNVDPTKTGLLSWSYAGESAIIGQMNNPEIDLVIGLSSIGFSSGVYLGSNFIKKINLEKINVPYLILSERIAPSGKKRKISKLFDALHPNSRYIFFEKLAHGNFNVIEGMIPGILNTNKVHSWSKGGVNAQLGYETICKISLSYLNTIFNRTNINSFDDNITSLQNRLPSKFISIHSPQ